MPNDPRSARTRSAISTLGHAAAGGHSKAAARAMKSPAPTVSRNPRPQNVISKPSQWDAWDDDGDDMPAYEFREYPKWVTHAHGHQKIVHGPDEEAEFHASGQVVRESEERARLAKIAEVKGLKVDKRWAIDRMKAAIAEAGHDPGMNPFA